MNSDNIVMLRWTKHLTLMEVAIPLGISPIDYMKYENGTLEIPKDILEKVINYLKM